MDNKLTRLNTLLKAHEPATLGTGELKFASEDGEPSSGSTAPSSENSKMTRQAQQHARASSSRAVFEGNKASRPGAPKPPAPPKAPTKLTPMKPLGFIPKLKPKI